ncbi:MAG: hypothetical protein E5V49_13130 [Mesorhizobium sp.]|nr:MAG: hypothetical protein E5V48_11240 [Mesorhizobium sp.]TJW32238.1 MAG: hypothetical protein E5V49_13130 [Mesorhizobium sp.]
MQQLISGTFVSRYHQTHEDRKLFEQSTASVERSIQMLRDTHLLVDPYRLSPKLSMNAVWMTHTAAGWRVTVKEAGVGTINRLFRERLSAFNFAQSHVMRLGVGRVMDD